MNFEPEFYDEITYEWDAMRIYGPTARHTRRFIFHLLDGITFRSVFDAGCGTGSLLQIIKEQYPNTQLAGSEYTPKGLDLARKRLPNAEFYTLDLATQASGKKYDLITCIDVLEHIPDDRAALKNLLAMTAGYVILSVPLGPLFKVETERIGHVHGYSRAEFDGKIRESGFEIVKAIQWGFPFYNIHRRIINILPFKSSTGTFTTRKRIISNLLYALFFLNISPGGERYYVLCRPEQKS